MYLRLGTDALHVLQVFKKCLSLHNLLPSALEHRPRTPRTMRGRECLGFARRLSPLCSATVTAVVCSLLFPLALAEKIYNYSMNPKSGSVALPDGGDCDSIHGNRKSLRLATPLVPAREENWNHSVRVVVVRCIITEETRPSSRPPPPSLPTPSALHESFMLLIPPFIVSSKRQNEYARRYSRQGKVR